MIDINIPLHRFPVLIIASPRTGSSALLKHLAFKYNVTRLGEIFIQVGDLIHMDKEEIMFTVREKEVFYDKLKSNKTDYILKLMPKEINCFSKYEDLLNTNCYKIALTRKSLVNQVASLYVASEINKFHTYVTDTLVSYTVEINTLKIINLIELLSNSNFLVKNLNYSYDLKLEYEDLGILPEIKSESARQSIISHKPTNYEEIKSAIAQILKNIR